MFQFIRAAILAAAVAVVPIRLAAQEHVFAEIDGVQLLAIPQPSPGDGYLATTIQARTVDPTDEIITITNFSASNVHQVWAGNGIQADGGSLHGIPSVGPDYAAEWIPYDSHLLIQSSQIVGEGGGGYLGMYETNNLNSPLGPSLPSLHNGEIPAATGLGDIRMQDQRDAFALHPDFQKNTLDLAYLVTQDSPSQPPVEFTVGLLGYSFDPEESWVTRFGYDHDDHAMEQAPIRLPIGRFESRIGSIQDPTGFSGSFGDAIPRGSATNDLYFPITAAAAPDEDASYSVALTSINTVRNDNEYFNYAGPSQFRIPAGSTYDLGPFRFNSSEIGDWSAQYGFSFDDGTVVDVELDASVVAAPFVVPTEPEFEVVIAEFGGIQLVAIPQPAPGQGFLATKVQARTTNPDAAIVTLTNLGITGIHQVWSGDGFQSGDTAKGRPAATATYGDEWAAFDSHLLISPDMVGGDAGGGYSGIAETNDGTTTHRLSLPPQLDGLVPAMSGYGPIRMPDPDGAFFLKPEFQGNTLDIAYLVAENTGDVDVELALGILGSGNVDAAFGYAGYSTVEVPFGSNVPEPCGHRLLLTFLLAAIPLGRNR